MLDAGGSGEDYSFAAAGGTQWSQAAADLSPRWKLIAGQTFVRRFGISQGQAVAGAVAKLSPVSAVEAKIAVSPEDILLPDASARLLWYRGLPLGFTFNPGYAYSRYETAHVHAASIGFDWEQRGGLVATARAYGTLSRFRGGAPARLTPGAFAQVKIPLFASAFAAPYYSYREESFQAGAPGALASAVFEAHAAGLGLLYEFPRRVTARAAWEYEARFPRAYMRRWELSLSWRPGS